MLIRNQIQCKLYEQQHSSKECVYEGKHIQIRPDIHKEIQNENNGNPGIPE